MINKSLVYSEYNSSYLDIDIFLNLDSSLIYIIGDSGSGKSFLWQVFNSDSAITNDIVTYNYTDMNKPIFDEIKTFKNKLIVMDNCNIILSDELKKHIIFDTNNQYILIGRNIRGLFLNKEQFKKVKYTKGLLTLENAF